MIKLAHLLLPSAALLSLLAGKAYALSDYFFGTVDKYAVVVELQRSGDALSGWYFYRTQARDIQLSGTMGHDSSFQLYEMVDGKKTAVFEGTAKDGTWQGNWHKINDSAAPLSFTFKPADKQASSLDGTYNCTGKRHDSTSNGQYQSDLRWNLKLSIAAGRVRSFSTSQTTRMDDHSEQACSLDLRDLQQQPPAKGIFLKAKRDDDGDANDNADGRDCTVRIVGDADTAVIKFGASGKDGDDCHGASTTMFCSARGGWGDLVLDRKANTCKVLR